MREDGKERRRIALFGGTFDPIHSGHLQIAQAAAQTFALDQVLFIPAANPPHKATAELTPYADRLRMCEIACAPYPQFAASALESSPEKSYTVDTLERARRELFPTEKLFFLIGADAFDEIETWQRWQDLIALTEFIVISRPGVTYRIPEHARVRRLDNLQISISSSSIRARLTAGEPTHELPAEVCDYIRQHGLYESGLGESAAAQERLPDGHGSVSS